MLFTPEMSGLLDRDKDARGGQCPERRRGRGACRLPRSGPACIGLWVHLGSLALRADGGKLANRGFVIDPNGEIRARYDKIHLFDVDLADRRKLARIRRSMPAGRRR